MKLDDTSLLAMSFDARLSALRKSRSLTQQALAERVGISLGQLKRYEAGTSQPTLDVIKRLAVELGVSSDTLLFEEEERGPSSDLRLQFEAISRFPPEHREVVKTVLEGLILKYEAERWTATAHRSP